MKTTMIPVLVAAGVILGACAGTPARDADARAAAIAAAVADPARYPEHRERDARSRPAEILGYLQVEPGDTVADILGGGGYYAELLVRLVGPDGTVILQNNTPYMRFVEKLLDERYGDGQVPQIRLVRSEVDDLRLGANSLDAALMVMSYHDLYYVNEERGWGNTDIPAFLGQLYTALKPGARLVIIDHAAREGSGTADTQEIHRIGEQHVREDFERAGFRLVATSDALRNPDDPRTQMVFDQDIRGKTDRFVLIFER